MKKNIKDTRWMVSLSLMAAIVILLSFTPLGMIQLPIIKATTVHIPVIVGAILLGPLAGGVLGAIFGICSMINNTIAPALLSFAFSPFLSSSISGALKSLWIAIGCRILIGVIAGWLWIFFRTVKLNIFVAFVITGFIGSMVNTVFVMGSINFLLREEYAKAREVALDAVFKLIMLTVGTSGVPEAIAAAVLVTAIGSALYKVRLLKYSK